MNIILSLIIAFLNTSNFIFNHAFDAKVKTPEYVVKYCNAIDNHTFIDDSGNMFEINNNILRESESYRVVFYTFNTVSVLDDEVVDFDETEIYELYTYFDK